MRQFESTYRDNPSLAPTVFARAAATQPQPDARGTVPRDVRDDAPLDTLTGEHRAAR